MIGTLGPSLRDERAREARLGERHDAARAERVRGRRGGVGDRFLEASRPARRRRSRSTVSIASSARSATRAITATASSG
jgi:hypothetical protein